MLQGNGGRRSQRIRQGPREQNQSRICSLAKQKGNKLFKKSSVGLQKLKEEGPDRRPKRELIPHEKGLYALHSNWLREDYKLSLGIDHESAVYNKSMTRVFNNSRNASLALECILGIFICTLICLGHATLFSCPRRRLEVKAQSRVLLLERRCFEQVSRFKVFDEERE